MRALPVIWRTVLLMRLVQKVSSKATTVNISEEKGGDITQLREAVRYSDYAVGEIVRSRDLFDNSSFYIRKLHNAVIDPVDKWKYRDNEGHVIIPFIIKGPYRQWQRKKIRKAMNRIKANTCIRFRWRKRKGQKDYLSIINKADAGCFTTVGRPGGENMLFLEANGCMKDQTILHELLHVVGLWHEHQRYDRDKYVKIVKRNIANGAVFQFWRVDPSMASTYDVPYDYRSIMHYNKHAFAIGNRITMRTRDPRYQDVIGNVKDASPSDYLKVCRMYGCKECEKRQLQRYKPPAYKL